MKSYLIGPEQPERDFVAALESRGFMRPPFGGLSTRATLIKGDVWVGYVSDAAGIFGWGRGWRPFAEVLAVLDGEETK